MAKYSKTWKMTIWDDLGRVFTFNVVAKDQADAYTIAATHVYEDKFGPESERHIRYIAAFKYEEITKKILTRKSV